MWIKTDHRTLVNSKNLHNIRIEWGLDKYVVQADDLILREFSEEPPNVPAEASRKEYLKAFKALNLPKARAYFDKLTEKVGAKEL